MPVTCRCHSGNVTVTISGKSIDNVPLAVLVLVGVGELGVDVERDVLVLVFVRLALNLGCWSFVVAIQARYWSTICRVVVVETEGFEMGLLSVIIVVNGLGMGLLLGFGGCGMWLGVVGQLGCLTVVHLFGVLKYCHLGCVGVAVFMVLCSGPASGVGLVMGVGMLQVKGCMCCVIL